MSEVYLVIVVFKYDLKSQSVVETSSFLLQGILVVADLLTIPLPLLIVH